MTYSYGHCIFVTLDHKTSLFKIEIYRSSDSWINNLSIYVGVCYDLTIFGRDTTIVLKNLESEGAKNLNMEKIAFKFVQMKFLAMHITYKKWSFDIFTVGYLLSTFMEHDLYLISNDYFGIKEKWIILTYAGIKFEMSSFCA